jgi:flavin-dependent dehydrogenase
MGKQYDLIIVGAGPGGLQAARAAAEQGLNVAVLERKKDPRILTRACLQTLDSANEYMHHDLYLANTRDGRLGFPAHGFSVRYDGTFKKLYAWQLYTPNGHKIQAGDPAVQRAKGDAGIVSLALDKEVLIQSMIDDAEAVGVEIITGVTVRDVKQDGQGVTAIAGDRVFKGRYLIAADGVASRVATSMGLSQNRHFYFTLYALSIYMTGVELPDEDTIKATFGFIPEGPTYMYIAPLPLAGGDVVNVMPISADPRVNLKDALDYFMRRDYFQQWFGKAKTIKTMAAACPAWEPIQEVVHGRVLLVGDVGSTQELEITGALISGNLAGGCVAQAMREEALGLPTRGLDKYATWWRRDYLETYSHEEYLKAWAMPYVFTSEADLNDFFGLIKEPFAPAFNPHTMPHHMGQAIKKIVPILQKERPDLLEKLNRTKAPTKEIFAEVSGLSRPKG